MIKTYKDNFTLLVIKNIKALNKKEQIKEIKLIKKDIKSYKNLLNISLFNEQIKNNNLDVV